MTSLALSVPVPPELATLTDQAPRGDDWIFEIKFDGYRILSQVENGRAALLSRRGQDWSTRFVTVKRAVEALPVRDAILDGEVCYERPDGTTNFQALQSALGMNREAHLVYFVFDLLYLNGVDLRSLPLAQRKELLAKLLEAAPSPGPLRLSRHFTGDGRSLLAEACRLGLEGVIAKRASSPYIAKRTSDWLKIKCGHRQEVTIVGYTPPKGTRTGLGALLVAVREGDEWRYAGKVGTGFTDASLGDVTERLRRLARATPPLAPAPHEKGVTWVEPVLVAEVRFHGWTDGGRLRQGVFLGLREDKSPQEVVRETPA